MLYVSECVPVCVTLSISLDSPRCRLSVIRCITTAKALHCQCPSHRVNAQVLATAPTLRSDSARLSLSTSLHALQTRPTRSCLSARPLTAPSAWNVLVPRILVSSLPPKILLSNYLEQR